MTSVEKNTTVDWLLYHFLRAKLRRQFHSVHIRGLSHLQQLDSDRPVIAFSNHTNWWDGVLVFLLTRSARHKNFYCMMSEAQLAPYHFLTRIGAFSIDLDNPLRAAGVVRYAVHLLQRRTTLLWLFPQGDIASPHQPIEMRTGANYLATQANGAQMLPVAFRYEFFHENKPRILIEVGQPFAAHESSDDRIALSCIQVAQHVNEAANTQSLDGFEELLGPLQPPSKYWEQLVSLFRRIKGNKVPPTTPSTPGDLGSTEADASALSRTR